MKPDKQTIEWVVGNEKLTIIDPYKRYWPKEKYTKLDVLTYYKKMAPVMLPYFKNRPATVHFFPRGIEDFSYYKRDYICETIAGCHTKPYEEISQDKTIEVLFIDKPIGFLALAATGGLEFHPWSSRYPKYRYPDMVIFDLDTTIDTSFEMVLSTTFKLYELLNKKGINCYAKTSGGSGLHVYVPIKPNFSFEQVRNWVKNISNELATQYPNLISTQRTKGKTHVENKVTIDYLQNVVTRSTIAPYSLRAYPYAPISTPLTWEEIKKGTVKPGDFTILNVPGRVDSLGDIFAKTLRANQLIL